MRKTTPKKPSGENIPEAMRKTEAVKLRLPPDVAEDLRALADSQEMTVSGYIAALLRTMRENPTVECGELLEDLRGPFGTK